MITAFTNKFKDIFGHTHMPVSRKRIFDDDDDDDILRVDVREPARKRSRPLGETDDSPLTRSYSLEGHKILKGTRRGLSNIWSWMSSFITPSMPHEDGLTSDVVSSDLQYLGTFPRGRIKDGPTKRPAISRTQIGVSGIKRDTNSLASIDANFRFNPSLTSTVTKTTKVPSSRSLLTDKYLLKHTSIPKSFSSHHKKSNLLKSQSSVKRLYDVKYPGVDDKTLLKAFTKLTGKRRFCTQEAYRHEEKVQYQRLLQQFANNPLSSSFSTERVPSVISLSSNSRSSSPQRVISRAYHNPQWMKEKIKQFDETPIPKSPVLSSKIDYPSQSWLQDNLSIKMRPGIKEDKMPPTVNGDSQNGKDSEDDCTIVAEDIKPRQRRNSLECILLESPVFDEKWHKDLTQRYNNRAKMKSENAKKASELYKMYEEVRKKAHTSLEDRIAQRIKHLHLSYPSKIEEIEEEREEEEEEELPELTTEMVALIEDALDNRQPGKVLIDKFNIQITRRDIATLAGLNWLNDEVINFYMNLLMERGKNSSCLNVHAFNTFFYPKIISTGYSSVRRWTKKVDVFNHDLLLVPVHLGMHWCLATIDLRDKHIRYYDSMLGDNNRCLEALVKYLESEHLDKKQSKYDTSGFTLENVKNIPQQMNGSDCGMFACKFAEYLSRDAKITFDQQHMPYFRRRMIYEIVTGKLL
ncbi:LOW QUALITY PROTEIN: sentrin-specific protease 1-like [Palaemon carinicauda]|uniref:LOW QUALITY PROTEIN: sentrin-specific protease 1-like n=1 Tax=Palaemon carinicauda TaxID=392227 RepID=UPI0035B603F0